MHTAALVLACVLCASHGKRLQITRSNLESSLVAKNVSRVGQQPSWKQLNGKVPVEVHSLLARVFKAVDPTAAFDLEEVDPATAFHLGRSRRHKKFHHGHGNASDTARQQGYPPRRQFALDPDQSDLLWWSVFLGAWGALLIGLLVTFYLRMPSELTTTPMHRQLTPQSDGVYQVQRSGSFIQPSGGGHHGYDLQLIDENDFTEEERRFFLKRERKQSKRDMLLEDGLGSAALILGTAFSLSLANSSRGAAYCHFWEHQTFGIGDHHMTYRDWVNEAVMAFFFFLIGMEIKREVLFGSLTSMRKALLPCIAALGGMVFPVSLFSIVQWVTGSPMTGWAIPMATDIAFAMGIYNIFRKNMPRGAAAFLLTLATVDDLGGIAVIVVVFSHHIDKKFLLFAAVACGIMECMRRCRVRKSKLWILVGIALWYNLLRGGVNADIAGVITGFFIPTIAAPQWTKAQEDLPSLVDHYIHYWTGWANFFIMPLFAVANTAVHVDSGSASSIIRSPCSQGIMLGLLLGKPLGISGVSWLSLKIGVCEWPTGMRKIHLVICGLLGGIAFTMSLFLIEQSLHGAGVMAAKLAVIGGSCVAAVGAAGLLAMQKPT